MQVPEFPPVALANVDVEVDARYTDLRELTPQFDRQPYGGWCEIFRESCEASPNVDWHDAGFARCGADQVAATQAELDRITTETNAKFVAFLRRASQQQHKEVVELLELEGISHASREAGSYFTCR